MAQSAITVIERIKNELLLTSDKALCKLLDIKPNTLSTWKKRDTLDFNKVIALCNERQLNLNYIFFGEERETQPTEDVTLKSDSHQQKRLLVVESDVRKLKLVNTNRNIIVLKIEEALKNGIDEQCNLTDQ